MNNNNTDNNNCNLYVDKQYVVNQFKELKNDIKECGDSLNANLINIK